ncbi:MULTISPECIES: HlyD family type I secretion periplasmic adaptor subunit [unclassified Halomonas]|uniref:HlyD family type I secretion periplasmic adaptor subunit n=1 Tax=unclassified Halomonas TaxID=2609666 RepID=UPI0021E3844E|nr:MULTISPECIES: HlyD family type I secretion periplasmic adaptor subunit [unclassified Halomonas]UYG01144.1 HlyD family type I secretion periplasmic adaptor subunit [Halomonas sp. GD1P12]WNL37793.1 HlyD family type I secretion periplasmic adaptor subunit [Halomonas sp. PAMB 3232]
MNTQTPPGFPAAANDELPLEDTRYRRMGVIILAVAIGGFGSWSVFANLAVSVVAPGSVSVESFTKTVQHLEGGIVERILVEDGDHVGAGDVLMVLDDTQARSQLEVIRANYLISRATEVRLLAELSDADTLDFPVELTESTSPRVQDVLDVQRRLFHSRRASLESTLASLDEQVTQMNEQIQGLTNTQSINQRRIGSLENDAANHRQLFQRGMISSQRLHELERESLEYQSVNAQHAADVARLNSQVSENTLQKQVRLQEFQQQVGEALRQTQAEVADAEERLTALLDNVDRTEVIAPVTGTVVGLQVHTPGGVIRPGEALMDIVPSNVGFIVEARVPDHDIDHLYHGQPAEIRFSAFNQRLSNVIEGEVVHISADSFEDEATRARYYKVRLRVTPQGEENMTESMTLLAGMPAEVMLKTGDRSFASYIAKPITDMLARAMRED